MEKKEKVFANGFIFKRSENAPEWVIGKLSAKEDEAIAFIKENSKNGWVNMNINKGQNGKFYIELDTWEKSSVPSREINPMSMAIDNERHMQEVRNSKSDLPF
jgi:hypothetical protein